MTLKTTIVAGAMLLIAGVAILWVAPRHTDREQLVDKGRERDALVELRQGVARLEAEVAEMRKTLVLANRGTSDSAEVKNTREVAKLRTAELLQRTQNTQTLLREVRGGIHAGQQLLAKINELNNDLTALWLKMAGLGLGRDPYLDDITLSNSGFSRAKPPPDHGIPGPYAAIGLPRLHERFLAASGIQDQAAEKKSTEFKKLVQAYANPAVYTHRDFSERACSDYREGKGLFTPQYSADLTALDRWLTDLETVLEKVPGYFDKAP